MAFSHRGSNFLLIIMLRFTGRRRRAFGVSRRRIFRISRSGVLGFRMRQNRRTGRVREGVIVYRLDQSNHQREQFVI